MAEQVVEDGAILTTENGIKLQCVAVRYQENEAGERHSHQYVFRAKSEIDAEREAEEKRQAEEAEAATSENVSEPTEEGTPEESPQVESENSPEGSDEKTTQENSLPLN